MKRFFQCQTSRKCGKSRYAKFFSSALVGDEGVAPVFVHEPPERLQRYRALEMEMELDLGDAVEHVSVPR